MDDIGAITVANSIKTATLGLADGEAVHEIMVVRLDLKGDAEPTGAIGAIAAANPPQARVPLRAQQEDLRGPAGPASLRQHRRAHPRG